MDMLTNDARALAGSTAEMDRLGHEIAELSAHLGAAVARLLDLIREPEVGELLVQALNAAREVLYQRTHRTFSDASSGDVSTEPLALEQQQADALALLAETALHHGIDPGAPGDRYQVVVHVDAPALADAEAPGQSVLENGEHVPARKRVGAWPATPAAW